MNGLTFIIPFLLNIPNSFSGSTGPTTIPVCCPNRNLTYSEEWDFFAVRPGANLFYWLYYEENTDNQRPWIMWLQGGPGTSGTGFGNFHEIGPLDVNLNVRNTTWLSRGDLLFVDSPVGTGFSYVTDEKAYTRDVGLIARDLINFTIHFLTKHQKYRARPCYIASESYGGKMAAVFAWGLYQASQEGNVSMNFGGVGLGDSWISPIDFVDTWPDYLFYFSRLSAVELIKAKSKAVECDGLVKNESWVEATTCWMEMEGVTGILAGGVSWYDVLKQDGQDAWSLRLRRKRRSSPMLYQIIKSSLYSLMNGPIRTKLGIIPDSVKWEESSDPVFHKQLEDFMKPVVDTVDALLNHTNLTVFVFNGQLDLICDTAGVERWVNKLKWPYLGQFQESKRKAIQDKFGYDETLAFYKKFKHFYFFYILKAGHMMPADAPLAGLSILDIVTGT